MDLCGGSSGSAGVGDRVRNVLEAVRKAGSLLWGARGRALDAGAASVPNPWWHGAERRWLRIASPCRGSWPRLAAPDDAGRGAQGHVTSTAAGWDHAEDLRWRGFCACCKRPLTISLTDPEHLRQKRLRSEGAADEEPGRVPKKNAFVVAIWGANVEYVVGAMVLGMSLRRVGTKHHLVAMHTGDVPEGAVEFLRRAGWIPWKVDYVEAKETLFQEYCLNMRFKNVFTKLHVLGLVQYDKVVMLDADLIVRQNIDDLFDLPAPAAMARGPWAGYRHGDPMDGQYFFKGARDGEGSWGQSSGINAGVMLLQPCRRTFEQCLAEVKDANHPEHIRGNGPEQDYLSRFFASSWRHIDVAYNFQLHQMYFALSPACVGADRAVFWECPEQIKVFHYSSEPKPWARYLDSEYACLEEDVWVQEVKRRFMGYKAWVLKDPYAMQSEAEGSNGTMAVGPDGKLRKVLWDVDAEGHNGIHTGTDAQTDEPMRTEEGFLLGDVLEADKAAIEGAEKVTRLALQQWDENYRELAAELGVEDLANAVKAATKKPPEPEVADDCETTGEMPVQESTKQEWKAVDGWWLETPVKGRAVASCGTLPAPHVLLSYNNEPLHVAQSEGLHMAAVATAGLACPAPCSLAGGDLIPGAFQWADSVPAGATVLVAIVCLSSAELADVLAELAAAGLGCPTTTPPAGYTAMVAIGRKGEKSWHSTHAAADVALATSFVGLNGAA